MKHRSADARWTVATAATIPPVPARRAPAYLRTRIGTRIAEQLNRTTGPIILMLPLGRVSAIDKAGQPFHDPDADRALFAALRAGAAPHVRIVEVDTHINDVAFADAVSAQLRELLREQGAPPPRREDC